MLNENQRKSLLAFAYDVINARLNNSPFEAPKDDAFAAKKGIFVSLHIGGELRGCIGYILPYKSIVDSVQEMAIAAAFRDPRFPPLSNAELPRLEIEISLLGELIPMSRTEKITIGRDGLYLDHPDGSGLLLPQVATEYGWDSDEFLKHLCRKAGLAPSVLDSSDCRLYRFEAEIFSMPPCKP